MYKYNQFDIFHRLLYSDPVIVKLVFCYVLILKEIEMKTPPFFKFA